MMKNIHILLLAFLSIAYSELGAQEVISSSGNYLKKTNLSISWTLGETVCATGHNSDHIITQGFQQSKLQVTSIRDLTKQNVNFHVFPNPTRDKIIISIKGKKSPFHLKLFNTNGELLLTKNNVTNETSLNMKNYKAAIYILRITDNRNNIIKMFKIVKQ